MVVVNVDRVYILRKYPKKCRGDERNERNERKERKEKKQAKCPGVAGVEVAMRG